LPGEEKGDLDRSGSYPDQEERNKRKKRKLKIKKRE
jgi:hypothetical protein